MTITVVQSGGTLTDNATNASRVFASNVTAGNKVVICAFRYADTDTTGYAAGDCTKTAGTSTISAVSLISSGTPHVNYHTSVYIGCGMWAFDVTGTGSLTVQAAGAASNYHGVVGIELNASSGWDAGYLEDTATATTGDLAQRLAALIDDLKANGALT